MRCLTPSEAVDLFGGSGFSANFDHSWYRVALVLDRSLASRQDRVGGRPPQTTHLMSDFAGALNRWHPTNKRRLLWVDHVEQLFGNIEPIFRAARCGLGEQRTLGEAPGHCFDALDYAEQDQLKVTADVARESGLLIGLASLIMLGAWDGWLIAEGSDDRIEFWEGNIFFYSNSKGQLEKASQLMSRYDCPRDLI
jgi:hypothetical protein